VSIGQIWYQSHDNTAIPPRKFTFANVKKRQAYYCLFNKLLLKFTGNNHLLIMMTCKAFYARSLSLCTLC